MERRTSYFPIKGLLLFGSGLEFSIRLSFYEFLCSLPQVYGLKARSVCYLSFVGKYAEDTFAILACTFPECFPVQLL